MMDANLNKANILKLNRTKDALEKNNINTFIAKDKEEALEIVKSLLNEGEKVSCGGSMSLEECGVIKELRSGKYVFLDRANCTDVTALYRECFSADAYLSSANAVTENGELFNVDGNGNRVAAICYGPSKIIMIVGKNKIVRDLGEAHKRVKEIAAPANCLRLSKDTPCTKLGKCIGQNPCEGCRSDGRICSSYVVSAYQRTRGRINVILVNEELGY